MTNPYQPTGQSPFVNAPLTGHRPRMFDSTLAKVIWTLVPVVTFGLGAAIPFVVAAVKGVVKPWIAISYVAAEVTLFGISTVAVDPDKESPFLGFLLVFLMATSATHTSLLDNDRVTVGK
ncbi:hypothetical protein ACFH04_12200 [Streptomyces noboritoensis]|uniref:Holin n=1 Tax=Streptomyces noboritoensis TaxID=67337 RepID=A0ABV6TH67_9ACTN